jgi:hypothetical protein
MLFSLTNFIIIVYSDLSCTQMTSFIFSFFLCLSRFVGREREK